MADKSKARMNLAAIKNKMFLVNYSSSSESDTEGDSSTRNNEMSLKTDSAKSILPKATTLLGKRKISSHDDQPIDDPSLHQGRIRSFKHERGNWATYVFISFPLNLLEDLQDSCLTHFDDRCDFKAATELHISLSKTVVLQYHFIESFVKNLDDILTSIASYSISLSQLKAYTNAERTRTFIAVKVDNIHLKKMLELLHKIDNVMKNFRLSTFYEDPSFHVSILWCVGDHVDFVNQQLPFIMTSIKDLMPIELKIDKIHCKSGFKEFNFELK